MLHDVFEHFCWIERFYQLFGNSCSSSKTSSCSTWQFRRASTGLHCSRFRSLHVFLTFLSFWREFRKYSKFEAIWKFFEIQQLWRLFVENFAEISRTCSSWIWTMLIFGFFFGKKRKMKDHFLRWENRGIWSDLGNEMSNSVRTFCQKAVHEIMTTATRASRQVPCSKPKNGLHQPIPTTFLLNIYQHEIFKFKFSSLNFQVSKFSKTALFKQQKVKLFFSKPV